MKKALQLLSKTANFSYSLLKFSLFGKRKSFSNTTRVQDHHHSSPTSVIQDSIKGSIPQEVHQLVGQNHFTLKYFSPAVRGRMIWGGLVPFDQVWVAGAHLATNVDFTQNIRIDGKVIAAGKYALFAVPGKKKWILILNSRWDQHLVDEYQTKEDVIRMFIKPEKTRVFTERLTYEILENSPERGTITMSWEKVKVSLDFTNSI
jgi:hypothetical protein